MGVHILAIASRSYALWNCYFCAGQVFVALQPLSANCGTILWWEQWRPGRCSRRQGPLDGRSRAPNTSTKFCYSEAVPRPHQLPITRIPHKPSLWWELWGCVCMVSTSGVNVDRQRWNYLVLSMLDQLAVEVGVEPGSCGDSISQSEGTGSRTRQGSTGFNWLQLVRSSVCAHRSSA